MTSTFLQESSTSYFQKTYAGWLGKIIGIRMGSPIEGWSRKHIKDTYGTITGYVQEYNDYAADDDSNGPLFFIRSLIDNPEKGLGITEEDMAKTWLNYVAEGHGFFWWGGYGVSSEHTAYDNLKAGVAAPRSGSIEQNGNVVANQIGGQIFIDSWGFVKPDDPRGAADLAQKMIAVSHDEEAIYGGRFITACISSAYSAKSVDQILADGLSVIPSDCIYAQVVQEVVAFHHKDEQHDWESCLSFLQATHGYDKYPGNCHVIPNAGVIILALLYGAGDFSKSMYICNSCGWDTDCNAGNLGSILGVFGGIEQFDEALIRPIHDLVLSSSVVGYLNIDTIARSAQMFCTLGYQLEHLPLPSLWKERIPREGQVFHFDMQRSTQSLRTSDPRISLVNVAQGILPGHRALQVHGADDFSIIYKTYYNNTDLTDSRYDPGFSPVIYPGQTFEFLLSNTTATPFTASCWFKDLHDGQVWHTPGQTVAPGETATISMNIPVGSFLVKEIALHVAGHEPSFKLDSFSIFGKPDYTLDFALEKEENYGFSNGRLHRELSQCTFSGGYWDYMDGKLSGTAAHSGICLTGYYPAKDYSLSLGVIPMTGEYQSILFRCQGAIRYYSFGFTGKDHVSLIMMDGKEHVLATCPFRQVPGREYKFTIEVIGNSISCNIDGQHLLTCTDDTYSTGAFGFAVAQGSHGFFTNVEISPR